LKTRNKFDQTSKEQLNKDVTVCNNTEVEIAQPPYSYHNVIKSLLRNLCPASNATPINVLHDKKKVH